METFLFKITFLRNGEEEVLEVLAPDTKTAMEIIYSNHPDYLHFDIENVDKEKTKI
jgi:hypothetical protein